MAAKRKLEFFLLRYVPDVVKGEFVNFGLVALEDRGKGVEVIEVRYTRDWERVLRSDPQADTDVLEAIRKELLEGVGQNTDRQALLQKMTDSFSGVLQISAVMPVLTERTIAEEVQTVAQIYLESPRLQRIREPRGRQAILDKMTTELEKAGVLGLMFPVPVEMYTKPGDPFAFDFGYNTGREIKLFHAVSIKTSVDPAVLLAARYQKITPEMIRLTQATPVLRAVVEDGLDEQENAIRFALDMMRESGIYISRVAELPEIAQRARIELKA